MTTDVETERKLLMNGLLEAALERCCINNVFLESPPSSAATESARHEQKGVPRFSGRTVTDDHASEFSVHILTVTSAAITGDHDKSSICRRASGPGVLPYEMPSTTTDNTDERVKAIRRTESGRWSLVVSSPCPRRRHVVNSRNVRRAC
ncbi:unnamed protein product [Soboliphyme baturini]|uniref:Uncharacterized protein n=1 Tax=Soboliphyme baturini TaxID=241478 RepID=A0A183J1Z9_9BILA|nr:unnamed protein product [Soboliphyme baturini]